MYVIVYLLYISNKSKQVENEVRYGKTAKAIIYITDFLKMCKPVDLTC